MSPSRVLPALCTCAAVLLTACGGAGTPAPAPAAAPAAASTAAGNPISGDGMPNPAPNVTRNWGSCPAGRTWGTSAGVDIDPKDGHIWAYERCGAGASGGAGGGPVDCDNTPVDPVFKFDRNTGAVLANIGKGVMVTPHGIHVDKDGNVWIADFSGNKAGDQGPSGPQVQPQGREAAEPRHRRQAGQRRRPVQPAERRRHRPRRQHLRVRRARRPGHDHAGGGHRRPRARRHRAHQQVHARRQVRQVVGQDRRHATASSAPRTPWRSTPRAACGWPTAATTASRSSTRRAPTSSRATPTAASAASSSRATRVYAIDSESGPFNHVGWRNGVRIGPLDEDRDHGVRPALRARRSRLPGHGRRRRGGRRRRQHLRRRRPELADPGGRRVHEIQRQVTRLAARGSGTGARERRLSRA